MRALVMNLMRRHLTREQKAKAVTELRSMGYTYERIAAETGIPYSTQRGLVTESDDVSGSANVITDSHAPAHIVDSRGRVQPTRKQKRPKLTVVPAKNTREAERAQTALSALVRPVRARRRAARVR